MATNWAYMEILNKRFIERPTGRSINYKFFFVSYLVIDVFRANLAPNNTSFLLPNKRKSKKCQNWFVHSYHFWEHIIVYAIKPPINLRSHSFVIIAACILNGWWCWCWLDSIIFAHMKANIILHLFHIEHTDTHSSTHTQTHTHT